MNMSYVISILDRAKESASMSADSTYRDILNQKIHAVEYGICLDQEVASLEDLELSCEINPSLEYLVSDLDVSIGGLMLTLLAHPTI